MPQETPVIYHHYEVLRRPDGQLWELGRGGMGVTYKALDTQLRTLVALKVIHADKAQNEVIYRYFLREAHAAALLSHPNIARVHYLNSDPRNCFYAMEFIDGETVERLVTRRTLLPEREALNIVRQVARALAAAQRVDLVHRDIKPPNIMLVDGEGDERHVKLIDFGLAKSYVQEAGRTFLYSNSFGFAGTPQFASPEQFDEQPLDCRSDIYSLGVTLWYMLTGHAPFRGNHFALIDGHRTKPPPYEKLPEGLSAGTRALLERMLAKDPAARCQTPAELRQETEASLEALRGQSTVAERQAPPAEALATETLVEPPITGRPSVTEVALKPDAPPMAPELPVVPTPVPAPVVQPAVPPPAPQPPVTPAPTPVSKTPVLPPPAPAPKLAAKSIVPVPAPKPVPSPASAPKIVPAAQPERPVFVSPPQINEPSSIVPPPAPTPIERGANVALLTGTAAVLLAAVALAVWLRWPHPQPAPPDGGGTDTPAPTATPLVAVATPTPLPASSPLRAALGNVSREQPYVNSRGMAFVPLPGVRALMGVTPVRRQDYAAFAQASSAERQEWAAAQLDGVPVGQGDDDPAVNVSWDDAKKFCAWLSRVDSAAKGLSLTYRLPTVAEWSAARGNGTYPWGEQLPPPPRAGNYWDAAAENAFRRTRHHLASIPGYSDGFATVSPVKAFAANALGLFDIGGNVKQWCLDPDRPEAWVYVGSSWQETDPQFLTAKTPGEQVLRNQPRSVAIGFRCVLDLPEN